MFFSLQPQTSSNRLLKISLALFFVIFIFGAFILYQFTVPASPNRALVPFTISTGQSVKEIGRDLQSVGLVRSTWWFESWVWLMNTEKRFITGDYQLPKNANVINLTKLLTGGLRLDNELTVQFPEGWTIAQMDDYLTQTKIFKSREFKTFVSTVASVNTISANYLSLVDKSEAVSLEGYLFPDTYRIFKDATVADVVKRMLNNFEKKFLPQWRAEIKNRGLNIHQVVTLASIVEREVKTDPDRAIVADIFWRRFKVGMGLEADSTVNYITGKSLPSVSYNDLSVDSPYNTYKYRGLPPGPISNPGTASLKAVVYPQPNEYWYFLTTPAGQVIYSKTYAEHLQAKWKYLK